MNKHIVLLIIGFLGLTSLASAQIASAPSGANCTSIYGYYGDHDGDGIPNYKDQDFLDKYKPAWANRPAGSAQVGDGTRPQPRDGTGFGAQKNGRGKVYGKTTNGTSAAPSSGVGQGQGRGRGRGNGLRKRDGSCRNVPSGGN